MSDTNLSPLEMAAAGLLHDIGKILQPAGIELHSQAIGLEQMICPVWQGRYSHRHVVYTAQALISATSNFGRMDRSRIERVANYHHRPSANRLDEHLLTKADWLASGHNRQASEEEKQRTGLAAIIATLSWPKPAPLERKADHWILPTRSLSFEASLALPRQGQSQEEYKECCRPLSEQLLNGLNTDYDHAEQCIDGLLALTQRLLHAVPASRSHHNIPDVSLYDHSRMVAAIAACLAVLPHEGPIETNKIQGRFRFVTLGVGGIQNFIFHTIPALEPSGEDSSPADDKGSAKRLRARSFYLSLASWVAARKVLHAAGMPMTNLIYDAGGHALLLIPDTVDIVQNVQAELDRIARDVRDALGGMLRFDYAVSKSYREAVFEPKQFQHALREIEAARANSRYRFPDPRLHDGAGWCDQGWVASEKPSLPIDRKEEFMEPMRKLGNALPKAEYLAIGSHDHGLWNGALLGMSLSLHEKKPRTGQAFALALHDDEPTTPLYLSGSHLPKASPEDVKRLRGHAESLDPDDNSIKVGETLTFSDLARLSNTDGGENVNHSMLGVLKADIDRLGALMTYGFTAPGANNDPGDERHGNRATIGRLAGLSRSLDQFFKGFLTEQLRTTYPHIYTVFVGGDDLFLIGPWYDLVRFTRDFHGWFEKLTCGNPNVTFSAGLVFTKPTTPIKRLATLSEEALEQAKSSGRNQISYGSVTLTWKTFHEAWALHKHLCDCLQADDDRARINASLTYRLLKYAKQALDVKRAGPAQQGLSPAVMKWRAQMNYDLKRNLPLPNKKEDELTSDEKHLCDLHTALLKIDSPNKAPVLYTAASLTLYLLRGETA